MDNLSDKNKSLNPITGECFCGAIKYQINGKLRDARSCHCPDCRKAFSAQFSICIGKSRRILMDLWRAIIN